MESFLDIKPGSVSVMGLMNDREKRVRLLIDKDILEGEYFACHPCINTSSLKFTTRDLMDKNSPGPWTSAHSRGFTLCRIIHVTEEPAATKDCRLSLHWGALA